ncbi:cell division protein FtsW [Thermincola ferriacetica]|uniref:Probable peptidoglycan glycosyltransferase FtsW n=1 Tax=Thermincola ferriacetica TaxID=281456 RepID=A0A0L6W6K5_9FIRM|nr:putative lipid II flippase FtsW [Thermincola ferriacetica]KNZ71212.1 cell division protein FtsW [Thermincola ferriacetica]
MKRRSVDWYILIPVLLLVSTGLIMVLSASSAFASAKFGKPFLFFYKQAIWSCLSICGLIFAANFEYKRLKRLVGPALFITLLLLVLLLIPGVADTRNGANSWLQLGPVSFQPSELVKLCTILILARVLANKQDKISFFQEGLLPPIFIIGVICVLIVLEKDLGTTMALAFTSFVMLFAAGARLSHLTPLALTGAVLASAAVFSEKYRLARFIAFMNPYADPRGTGYQIIQSLYAIGSGGVMGVGLGHSKQKFLYLPESYTDFIYSVLAEELGFIGGLFIIILFIIILVRGLRIAYNIGDSFGSLLAIGITSMITVEAIMNISVATGSMPVTGITLPFISYGGSSLFFKMVGVGILLNISKYCPEKQAAVKETDVLTDY